MRARGVKRTRLIATKFLQYVGASVVLKKTRTQSNRAYPKAERSISVKEGVQQKERCRHSSKVVAVAKINITSYATLHATAYNVSPLLRSFCSRLSFIATAVDRTTKGGGQKRSHVCKTAVYSRHYASMRGQSGAIFFPCTPPTTEVAICLISSWMLSIARFASISCHSTPFACARRTETHDTKRLRPEPREHRERRAQRQPKIKVWRC